LSTEYFNLKELAAYIRRSEGACRNLVLRRAIPFRKPSGRLLFDRAEIDSWVKGSSGISYEEISKSE